MRTNIVIDDQLLADCPANHWAQNEKGSRRGSSQTDSTDERTGRDKGLAGQTSVDGRSRCHAEGYSVMILVDTSVWVDYFDGHSSAQTDALDDALGMQDVIIGDLILTEVL